MKKITIAVLLLLTMVLSPLSALAAEWPDSLTIDSETRQILGVDEDAEVMRFYNGAELESFALGYSIETILDKTVTYISYVYPIGNVEDLEKNETYDGFGPSDGFVAKEIIDGVATEPERIYYHSCRFFYDLRDKHDKILNTLGENVTAKKMYYINSVFHWGDLAVYYVTNEGDYILYQTSSVVEGQDKNNIYFFSVKEFGPIMQKVWDGRGEAIGSLGLKGLPEEIMEYKLVFTEDGEVLTQSEIKRENHLVILYCGISVVILTAGGLWFFLRRRKKKEA